MNCEIPDPHKNGQYLARSIVALVIALIGVSGFLLMVFHSIDKAK